MDKRGAILIGGYSDYHCRGLSILMYLSGFIFTVLYIQLSSFLSQTQVYIGSTDFYLGICNVKV